MKKVVVGVVLLVVLLGTGGYAVAQSQGSDASYRTATARTASVEKTLNLSGTVSSAGRRDLSFGASGTVKGVSAEVGKRVSRNQVLARLDPTSLDATVTSAVATLAKAKAQLVSDEAAQSDAVAATAAADEAARKAKAQARKQAAAQAAASAQAAAAQATAQAELRKQQQAVTSAQSAATDAIKVASSALADEQTACAAASGTTSGSGSTGDPGTSGPAQACTTALSTVQDAQQIVAEKQQALQAAIATLTRTVTSGTSHSSSGSSGSAGHGAAPSSGSSSGSASSTSGTSGRGGGATVTAATLARDQASIDTATAQLAEARSARESATLRAPYAGRIVKVAVSKGEAVSASDTAFILVGSGVTEVTTSVTSTQLPSVRRGQRVTVTPAGWSKGLSGEVTLVGLLPDSSSSYPVVVTVQSSATIAEDTTASLAVVTGTASDAVTVPTSAVTRVGTRSVVRVLAGTSTLTSRAVTVGVVGNRVTSITAGLKAGEQVVIADLGAALPSGDSTTGTRRFGTGGFGGGGFGGTGGPPGAGRTGG